MRLPRLRLNPDGRWFTEIPNSGRKRRYFGTDSTDAQVRYQTFLEELKSGRAGTLNINSALDRFEKEIISRLGKSDRNHCLAVKHRLSSLVGEAGVSSFGPKTIQRFFDTLLDEKGSCSGNILRRYLAILKKFGRWLVAQELAPAEVWIKVDAYKLNHEGHDTVGVSPVDIADVVKTLPYLPANVAAMVCVQYLCGMRPSEVRRMRLEEIDTSGPVWFWRPKKHKGSWRGKSKRLAKAIPESVQEILAKMLAVRQDGYAFPSGPDRAYNISAYTRCVERAVKRAQAVGVTVNRWAPRQLRHAIGTEIRKIHGIEAAQGYLGHSRPDTTLIYAERCEEQVARIASSLPRTLVDAILTKQQ